MFTEEENHSVQGRRETTSSWISSVTESDCRGKTFKNKIWNHIISNFFVQIILTVPDLSWDSCGGGLNLSLGLSTTFIAVEHACCKDAIIEEVNFF